MKERILNNLRESVSSNLSKDLGLKIMAVLFAIFLWWAVVNIDDPIQTRKYMIDVTVTNPEVITTQGLSFQVDESTKQVTITVKARRKVIEEIKMTNIIATADMRELQGTSVPVRVSIQGYEGMYASAQAYPQNIQVNVEVTQAKTFPIIPVLRGNVRDGYMVGSTAVEPQSVEISGPESIVSKISKVVTRVDVEGLAASRDMNTRLVYYDAADNEIPKSYLTSKYDETGVDVTVKVWKTKKIDVEFDTSNIKAASGYLFNGLEYEPKTVEVAASSDKLSELETLRIPAEAIARDNIKESEEVIVDISQYLPKGVVLVDNDATSVAVQIQMEQIGTKRFSIPTRSVRVDGLAENLQLTHGPEQSTVIVFSGRNDALDALTGDGFVAYIDLTEIVDPGSYSIPILVAEQPEGCEYTGDAKINITLSVIEESNEEVPEGETEGSQSEAETNI